MSLRRTTEMKRFLCFVIVAVMLLSFVGCKEKTGTDTDDTTSDETTVMIGTYEKDVFEIETAYCTLKFPEKWQDAVEVTVNEGENTVVGFAAKDSGIKLFDIIMGDGDGDMLGTLQTENGSIAVKVVSYSFDSTLPDYETLCAITEDINVIINRLASEYSFSVGE